MLLDEGRAKDLTAFLRENDCLTRMEVLSALEQREGLWLNRLQPDLFTDQNLTVDTLVDLARQKR